MRKTLAALVLGAGMAFNTGCFPPLTQDYAQKQEETKEKVSYKLENILDADVSVEKQINLHVYIESSDIIWDYHDYRGQIFERVSKFFKNQNIKCNITYYDAPLKRTFLEPNEFGLEIYTEKNMINRFVELNNPENWVQKIILRRDADGNKGYAVPEKGIALINASWESFRGKLKKEYIIEEEFTNYYNGCSVKEYKIGQHADTIVHEILHCMSLPHATVFSPPIAKEEESLIPNTMSYLPPMFFNKKYPIGTTINESQKRWIHSFIAKKAAYYAFKHSKFDMSDFIDNIAKANDLKRDNTPLRSEDRQSFSKVID